MPIYYVDADNGSDAADGLSTGNAWQTNSKVFSVTFTRGDTIYYRRCEGYYDNTSGDVFSSFTGQLTPHTHTKFVGDDGNFGIGDWSSDTTTVVWMNNGSSTYALRMSSNLTNYGLIFQNIEWAGTGSGPRYRSGGNNIFKHCVFRGQNHSYPLNKKLGKYAIFLDYDYGTTTFDGCIFDTFTVAGEEPLYGVYSYSKIIFKGCLFHDCNYLAKLSVCSTDFEAIDSTFTMNTSMFTASSRQANAEQAYYKFDRCAISINDQQFTLDEKVWSSVPFHYSLTDCEEDWQYTFSGEPSYGYFENINDVPGPIGRGFIKLGIMYDSTSEQRSGGGDSMIHYRHFYFNANPDIPPWIADSTHRIMLSDWRINIPDADGANEYKVSAWAQATEGWGAAGTLYGLDKSMYITVEYIDVNAEDGVEIIPYDVADSTERITADDTWTELVVNFVPGRAGPAYIKTWLSDHYNEDAHFILDNYIEVTKV